MLLDIRLFIRLYLVVIEWKILVIFFVFWFFGMFW